MNNQEVYYCYHKKVYSKEHFLMAGEIAMKFKILSKANKPATNFVSSYLQKAVSNIPNYEQYYYNTRYGDSKVYPMSIYTPIMKELINQLRENVLTEITIDNKKYSIKFGGFKNENI